jgi:hypothetical protein
MMGIASAAFLAIHGEIQNFSWGIHGFRFLPRFQNSIRFNGYSVKAADYPSSRRGYNRRENE